ncbi:unnamed protein product [Didymodactylos carnosus]|uniref:oleoyl-[acyl-carrier-protein] hydrolase n=1 Tax=Didymodactylos carnosus TaxID=1234261 RepID=A0A814MR43_9BILA|nr:unnamed protein product [Didymodactylos carnosus]CAF1082039.1 unnamed protein product [Didymodactylos carnosus]CAF3839223.1 unnamed protein product [Didymodactylos carnosus]CAF3847822.1 unnamed protein product [Didymodactylos carnosus]
MSNNPWLQIFHSRPSAKYQVFIFPGAGSAGYVYQTWDTNFPIYEFALVEYPGRFSRFGEEPFRTLKEYIQQLDKWLVPSIRKPCVFIGHSLGTAISFALAKHMVDMKKKNEMIKLMVMLGRGPPHLKDPSTTTIYDDPDIMQMIIPMLKADSLVADELQPKTLLDIPIIVYGGDKEENVDEALLKRWAELTTVEDFFRVRMFHGHHMFHSECGENVVKCLKEDLTNIVEKPQDEITYLTSYSVEDMSGNINDEKQKVAAL